MGLVIEFPGNTADLISKQLGRMAARVANPIPAFQQIAARFALIMKEQFDSEGGRAHKWAPLSPGYAAQKELRYPGKPILQASGALMRSLTHEPFGVEGATATEMVLGTDIPYAIFHQLGIPLVPRRPVVDLTVVDRLEMTHIVQHYILTTPASAAA